MWIPRVIEELLRSRVEQRPSVVVTGARQTGKTSLVRRLFSEIEMVSLDLPSEAAQAERDPRSFLRRHPPPLIIDEIQYAPGLFRHLKVHIDAHRDRCGQFILTGSQRFPLMKSISESLAGRVDVLELEGLSWAEVHPVFPHLTLEDYQTRGGFPELYEKPGIDAAGYYRSYVATYLERDLRQVLEVSSLRDFERFIRACALRTSGPLNRADLARDAGISGSTAGGWLSILQTSGLVALLEPWFSNRTKSLVKTPKLYLRDSGLASFLCGIRSARDLADSPLAGALWETVVFAEIRRAQMNRAGGWDLHFWRDRSREADFLFHRGGRFELADAKWTEQPAPRDFQRLDKIASILGTDTVDRTAILCRCRHAYPFSRKQEAIPLGEILRRWGDRERPSTMARS